MTDHSIQHATFVIDRTVDAPVSLVYRAWTDIEAKGKWFAVPTDQWTQEIRTAEYRVGGKERLRGRWKNGSTSDFQAQYFDIVPERRIVYAYDMYVNDKKLSVSLATIEFHPMGQRTRMVVTEQGAFFDGGDDYGSRERGTNYLMDNFEAALRSEPLRAHD